ncbi:hypothetical protein, partial [Vibrio sagamiensis]
EMCRRGIKHENAPKNTLQTIAIYDFPTQINPISEIGGHAIASLQIFNIKSSNESRVTKLATAIVLHYVPLFSLILILWRLGNYPYWLRIVPF